MDQPYRSHSGYFNRAFGSIDEIALEMLEKVQDVEFDTMVGTGLSGTLVVPTLARAFGTHWAIIRKEPSPHSSSIIEGEIGQRWLFVDDFISSGRTLERVKYELKSLNTQIWDYNTGGYYYDQNRAQYVGTYEYEPNKYRSPT